MDPLVLKGNSKTGIIIPNQRIDPLYFSDQQCRKLCNLRKKDLQDISLKAGIPLRHVIYTFYYLTTGTSISVMSELTTYSVGSISQFINNGINNIFKKIVDKYFDPNIINKKFVKKNTTKYAVILHIVYIK